MPTIAGEVVFLPEDSSSARTVAPSPSYRLGDIIPAERERPVSAEAPAIKKEEPTPLFAGHELRPKHLVPQPHIRANPDWIFLILLLITALFAWVRIFYAKIFRQILQAFFNNNIANQIVRDENILVQKASVVLTVIFNLTVALYMYQLSIVYDWDPRWAGKGLGRFILFALIVSAGYSVKFLILKGAAYVFEVEKATATYIFNIFLTNNVLGMALLPLLVIAVYGTGGAPSFWLTISYLLIISILVYRILRGVSIGVGYQGVSIFHLFLYLCTLEFAPWLILVKLFTIV